MAENFTPIYVGTFSNDTSAVNAVNNNFAAVSTAFQDTLSLSGVYPNQMNTTLDMNGNQIINLPFPQTLNSPARLADITNAQNISIVTATTGSIGHVVPFLDANNTWSGTATFDPSAGLNPGITLNQTITGTASASFSANSYNITDFVNAGSNAVLGQGVFQTYGGSTVQGSRFALFAGLTQSSATSASNPTRNYSSLGSNMTVNSNDNGTGLTASTAAGNYGAAYFTLSASSSATNLRDVSSLYTVSSMVAGSSVWAKSLINMYGVNTDAVQGTVVNAMLWGYNQNTAAPWTNGILFDNGAGQAHFPISTAGSILKAAGGTVSVALDFSTLTTTLGYIVAPSFVIGNLGGFFSGSAGTSTGFMQVSGSTSGSCAFTTSVTGNTALITQGNSIQGNIYGNMLVVQGPLNTIANQLTLTSTVTGGSPQISAINSTDTNVNIVLAPKGTGIVSIQTNLTLGGAGVISGSLTFAGSGGGTTSIGVPSTATGALQFFSTGSFSANGSVATSLTSLGPSGSHTTVQTWLTIVDSGGTTRYIPCF